MWISTTELGSSLEGAHEFFTAMEYDAGASLHPSDMPARQHIQLIFNGGERHQPSHFQISKL